MKEDLQARSVVVMDMKPGIVALCYVITLNSVLDQTDSSLRHWCIVHDVRLRFESCLERIQKRFRYWS